MFLVLLVNAMICAKVGKILQKANYMRNKICEERKKIINEQVGKEI